MKESTENLLSSLLVTVVGIPLIFFATFLICVLDTWVLSKLWVWFLTPTFNIEVPSLPYLFGIALIGANVTHQTFPNCEKKEGFDWGSHLSIVFKPLIFLITGYLCKTFFL